MHFVCPQSSDLLANCAATRAEKELDWNFPAVHFEDGVFQSGLRRCDGRSDHGWSDPGGKGFMVRSVTYNNDGLKVCVSTLPHI